MNWQIPAKTFLLGEYSALAHTSALLVTTTPFFELALSDSQKKSDIHPQSPAGLLWQELQGDAGLSWFDPYQGIGGLGASSAQFLGCFLAHCHLEKHQASLSQILKAYYRHAWSGEGVRPSGYDLIAQSQKDCVFINKQQNIIQSYPWSFEDLSFVLIHTGTKLATHQHLQVTKLPTQTDKLSQIVDQARTAFEQNNSYELIQCINNYHQALESLDLVAPHSLKLINQLKNKPEISAIKGCGALGADVLLLICKKHHKASLMAQLSLLELQVLATEDSLSTNHSCKIQPIIDSL